MREFHLHQIEHAMSILFHIARTHQHIAASDHLTEMLDGIVESVENHTAAIRDDAIKQEAMKHQDKLKESMKQSYKESK